MLECIHSLLYLSTQLHITRHLDCFNEKIMFYLNTEAKTVKDNISDTIAGIEIIIHCCCYIITTTQLFWGQFWPIGQVVSVQGIYVCASMGCVPVRLLQICLCGLIGSWSGLFYIRKKRNEKGITGRESSLLVFLFVLRFFCCVGWSSVVWKASDLVWPYFWGYPSVTHGGSGSVTHTHISLVI